MVASPSPPPAAAARGLSFHSRAPSSPAVALHHLHIAIQAEEEDESAGLPSTVGSGGGVTAVAGVLDGDASERVHSQSRPPRSSLSSYASFEPADGASHSAMQLHPVSVPSPLPSSPPSPSGTGSSTPVFFASLEQQKRELMQEQAGRMPRHRHSVLASLPAPPSPPQPPQHTDDRGIGSDTIDLGALTPPPATRLPERRRELCHHQRVLSSHYCSSLLAARAADSPYPLLFCVLSRRIAHEGDNFLLYSYPSSSSLPLHLLALIHTFAIVSDAAAAITAQTVRQVLLAGDGSRARRDVVVSVQEEDERLYVLALTGVGQAERRQWEVRVEPLLSTLRRVLSALFGQPHAEWFDPELSESTTTAGGEFDPSQPVAVSSVPASGGSFISALLVLASSYYSLSLLDPLLRLFCHRLYSFPSSALSFTPLCGLLPARTMDAAEESAWSAALTRLLPDKSEASLHSQQPVAPTAFALKDVVLYHRRVLVQPTTRPLVPSQLSPRLLLDIAAILALNGLFDESAPPDSHTGPSSPSYSSSSSSPSSRLLRSRVFRLQLPLSSSEQLSSDSAGQAVLSVAGQADWLAAALLPPSSPQPSPRAAVAPSPLSSDGYYVDALRSLLAALSLSGSPTSHCTATACRAASPCSFCRLYTSSDSEYSFSVSPAPFLVCHPGLRSLCPELHTAVCRLQSLLLAHSRRLSESAERGVTERASEHSSADTAPGSSPSFTPCRELGMSARDSAGTEYCLHARWKSGATCAVLLLRQVEAEEVAAEQEASAHASAAVSKSAQGGAIALPPMQLEQWFDRGWALLTALRAVETDG